MNTPRHRIDLRREDGFTLSEMLVSIAVLGILFAVASMALSSAIRHSDEVEDQAEIQTEVRAAVDSLSRDLRQAYSGDVAVFPITAATGSTLTVLSPDRAAPFHLREVQYRVTGGRLERRLRTSTDTDGAPWVWPGFGPWQRVLDRVQNAAPFVYRTELGAVTTTPSQVATVEITLQTSANSSATRVSTYRTSVTVRADA
jgi:prepilin-type N-terminal cleavage/methylation domain-containing protein